MYQIALILHIISGLGIGYVVAYGAFVIEPGKISSQFKINLNLLAPLGLLSLGSATWLVNLVGYSHSQLWIMLSYILWVVLILINEIVLRRKYRAALSQTRPNLNVSREYVMMFVVFIFLLGLMIIKPF